MGKSINPKRTKNACLWFGIIAIVAAGVFFRFYNIDKKLYWTDEVTTSLWISGYTWSEVIEQLSDRVVGIEDLKKFQSLNSNKGFLSTIKALAIEDTQHPPLYYGLLRIWINLFSESIWVIRTLSACIGLLALPFIFWLCWELFESKWVAWMAVAILAVSPVNVLLSQEARQYSLWTVTILFSSAALLRALRLNSGIPWVIYAVTIILGIYTHTLFILVIIAHGVYIFVIQLHENRSEPIKIPRGLISYVIATTAGLLAFLPWAYLLFTNLLKVKSKLAWLGYFSLGNIYLMGQWGFNYSSIFFDAGYAYRYVEQFDALVILSYCVRVIILLLIAYSLYFLYSNTGRRIWFFIFSLVSIPFLTLAIMDLVLGGSRSGNGYKYLIPSYLGVEIAVAYLLSTKINYSTYKKRIVWHTVFCLVVLSGILSCAISSKNESWWNKGDIADYYIPEISRSINQSKQPILITELNLDRASRVISLSHHIKHDVRLLLLGNHNILQMPDGYSDVFVYNPSLELKEKIEEMDGHTLEVENKQGLWLIRKKQENRL